MAGEERMPKYIDHEQRRSDVAAAAAELVADRGRSALTVRNVAEAVGCSTTVVSHYFDDMADLLHATYALAAGRARERMETVLAADPTDVRGVIEAVLPLDAERRRDWRIWFAFWSEALASPRFAEEQRERARTTSARLRRCLRALEQRGDLPAGLEIRVTADRLATLIPGIAAEAIFDPRRWTPRYQRRILTDELRLLGLDRTVPPTAGSTRSAVGVPATNSQDEISPDLGYDPVTFERCSHVQGPFYHGTTSVLKVGDRLTPGRGSNYQEGRTSNNVYFSAILETAVWGAELSTALGGPGDRGHIYVVEPTGPFEDDPNVTNKKFPGNITQSYRTRHPVLIVGEVRGWHGHPPEVLNAMLDNIARLREQGLDVIED
jgi:rifampin ADP-ribosylating transferase